MIKKEQIKEINLKDKDYPFLLSQIPSPPQSLYIVGDVSLLNKNTVTIVGSRKMSMYGRRMAEKFTKELAREDLVIVSGLARGVDGVVHKTCVDNGGKTVAVLGHGFDRLYPPEHKGLAQKILFSGGCLLTEFPMYHQIERKNFVLRDRIMAGLSLGTLVIEGRHKSGTKITATMAADYGREVFAVLGAIDNVQSEATADLIKDGAKAVTKVEDILEELRLS